MCHLDVLMFSRSLPQHQQRLPNWAARSAPSLNRAYALPSP
jgi:hypothetical protein